MPLISRITYEEIQNRKNSLGFQTRINFKGDKVSVIKLVKQKLSAEESNFNLEELIRSSAPKKIKGWVGRINSVDYLRPKPNSSEWDRRNASFPAMVNIANEVIDWSNLEMIKRSPESLLIHNALYAKEETLREKENKIGRLREILAEREKSEWTKDALELNKKKIENKIEWLSKGITDIYQAEIKKVLDEWKEDTTEKKQIKKNKLIEIREKFSPKTASHEEAGAWSAIFEQVNSGIVRLEEALRKEEEGGADNTNKTFICFLPTPRRSWEWWCRWSYGLSLNEVCWKQGCLRRPIYRINQSE